MMNKPKRPPNHLNHTFPITPEDGQERIDEWLNNLPSEVNKIREELNTLVLKFESFQLIANISHLNHLRNMDKPYDDYNEGRMEIIPELIALLAIQNNYQIECKIDEYEFKAQINHVNELASKYLGMSDAIKTMAILPDIQGSETTLQKVTNKLTRDETWVRNPGFPEHHFEISEELFRPLSQEIIDHFGFSLEDSIIIRKKEIKLQNEKFAEQINEADRKGGVLKDEVVKFRNTGYISADTLLSTAQLHELKGLPSKKLKQILSYHFRNEVYYALQNIYALNAEELATYCNLSPNVVKRFLDCFSCTFNTCIPDDELMGVNNLLKTKPIIRHNERYIVPSFSMLTWAVEPYIEEFIKTSPKLSNKYKDIKHTFLLQKGLQLIRQIMPDAMFYPENLYYDLENGNKCETDALISYNDTLFIIEAKGHRLSTKAKAGSYQRTDYHLKDMIGEAAAQAKRTTEYIKRKGNALFHTKKNEQVFIDRSKYHDFITISLTLEPIGNLTPLMKVSNDLNYFDQNEFPWIVSIYDLIVFADHFEIPIQFLHYLKRRQRFLEVQNLYVFEEIDLLGYYLSSALYIEPALERAEREQVHTLTFDNHTDEFNDYYMYKYGHKEKFTPKMKSFISDDFKTILRALEKSNIPHKTKIMLELLGISHASMKKFTDYIKAIKKQFIQDGKLHDCSIGTQNDSDNIGITYMTGPNKVSIDESLKKYCEFKFMQQNSSLWLGIGDVYRDINNYDFQCSFFLSRK